MCPNPLEAGNMLARACEKCGGVVSAIHVFFGKMVRRMTDFDLTTALVAAECSSWWCAFGGTNDDGGGEGSPNEGFLELPGG